MRVLVSLAVVHLSVASLSAAPDAATRALLEAGHWKQARALLEPRVKANPSDAEATALLARVRAAFGDLDGALPLAETAVRLEPKSADYHWTLAEVVGQSAQHANLFRQIGLARRFRSEADITLQLDPKHIDAHLGMVSYYIQAPSIVGGDKKKADAMAEEIGRLDPATGFLAKAQVLTETKTPGDREGLYKQAIDAAKTPEVKWQATVQLMNFYFNASPPRHDGAEPLARSLVKIDPARPAGYSGLAIVYASAGRIAELDGVLGDAARAVPENLAPFFQAGRVLGAQGNELPRAERYLRTFLAIQNEPTAPSPAQARWRLGLVLEKQGRKAEAVTEIEQAVKLNPSLDEAKKDLKRIK